MNAVSFRVVVLAGSDIRESCLAGGRTGLPTKRSFNGDVLTTVRSAVSFILLRRDSLWRLGMDGTGSACVVLGDVSVRSNVRSYVIRSVPIRTLSILAVVPGEISPSCVF